MRRGFGFAWALVSVLVVGAASWLAYHAGVMQGLAEGGHPADGATAVPYTYAYHGGFGFGIFPLFLFILLLFFLFRRPWGHRHWGGYRGGWGGPGGPAGPGGWGGPGSGGDGAELPPPIEQRMQAWHERAHGTAPAGGDAPPNTRQD